MRLAARQQRRRPLRRHHPRRSPHLLLTRFRSTLCRTHASLAARSRCSSRRPEVLGDERARRRTRRLMTSRSWRERELSPGSAARVAHISRPPCRSSLPCEHRPHLDPVLVAHANHDRQPALGPPSGCRRSAAPSAARPGSPGTVACTHSCRSSSTRCEPSTGTTRPPRSPSVSGDLDRRVGVEERRVHDLPLLVEHLVDRVRRLVDVRCRDISSPATITTWSSSTSHAQISPPPT